MNAPWMNAMTCQRSFSVSDCFHCGMTVPGTPSLSRQKKNVGARF